MYKEEEFLQLSGIQHFEFCRRQWALAYIELQWQENVRTVEGKILHENAHDVSVKEKRGDLIVVRAMPIHSREMGVSGECDVVEFHKVQDGISLDSYVGFFHTDRPGRMSLALDLMEEFRSVMVDRFVLTLINKKIMKEKYFIKKENGAVIMTDEGRKAFLSAWQSKKQETIKHPFFK